MTSANFVFHTSCATVPPGDFEFEVFNTNYATVPNFFYFSLFANVT